MAEAIPAQRPRIGISSGGPISIGPNGEITRRESLIVSVADFTAGLFPFQELSDAKLKFTQNFMDRICSPANESPVNGFHLVLGLERGKDASGNYKPVRRTNIPAYRKSRWL
jgi:hypothetical protein